MVGKARNRCGEPAWTAPGVALKTEIMPNTQNIRTPVTLVGSHRSGTSLISNLFERHPQFAIAGETANLIFYTWRAGEFSADNIPPLMEDNHWVSDEECCARLVRQAFLTALPDERPSWFHKPIGIPQALSARFSDELWPQAAEWYWKVLKHAFPEARYFTILRHPCDVVLSTCAVWGFDQTTVWWSLGFMAYLLTHPASPVTYAIEYDRMLQKPREAVHDLFEQLGVPFHGDVLEAFSRVHAPAKGRENIAPGDTSRRTEWPRLDPAKVKPAYLRPIKALFERFGTPLDLPDSFTTHLVQHGTSEAATADPCASTTSDPTVDPNDAVVRLNQQIEKLHVEYADKLRQKERDAYKVYAELTQWNSELKTVKVWLEEQLKTSQNLAEERERIIQDQKKWIQQLEEAKCQVEKLRPVMSDLCVRRASSEFSATRADPQGHEMQAAESKPMQPVSDLRDEYVASVVSGKTFADVGGLWGTVNEKVSVAHRHGATALTMIDITPPGSELWAKFRDRMVERGIANIRCISRDVCQLTDRDITEPFDVVHCSGVLYHYPNPLVMLAILRRITREHLVLTSAVTQTVIENEQGRYELPPSGAVFIPALSDSERSILKTYWQQHGISALGLTERCDFNIDRFAPWWWLPTSTAMTAMCRAAGFTVRDAAPTWGGNSYTLLLSA